MSSLLAWAVTVGIAVALALVSVCQPEWLGDANNSFLAGFVNHELLAFLGVVVAITLASAANLHLELNKLEDAIDRKFPLTRRSIRLSSYSLIALLAFGFVIVATKPLISDNIRLVAAWNSAAIIVIVFNVFVLIDLTRTVLAVPSKKEVGGE